MTSLDLYDVPNIVVYDVSLSASSSLIVLRLPSLLTCGRVFGFRYRRTVGATLLQINAYDSKSLDVAFNFEALQSEASHAYSETYILEEEDLVTYSQVFVSWHATWEFSMTCLCAYGGCKDLPFLRHAAYELLKIQPMNAGYLQFGPHWKLLMNSCTCENPGSFFPNLWMGRTTIAPRILEWQTYSCGILGISDRPSHETEEETMRKLTYMAQSSFLQEVVTYMEQGLTPCAAELPRPSVPISLTVRLNEALDLAPILSVCVIVSLLLLSAKPLRGIFNKPRPNMTRYYWQCECGDHMYGDYYEADTHTREKFQRSLSSISRHKIVDRDPSYKNKATQSEQRSTNHEGSESTGSIPNSGTPPVNETRDNSTASSNHDAENSQQTNSLQTATCNSNNVSGLVPRFFELCINTNTMKISLGELNLGPNNSVSLNIQTDVQLFKLIHDRYFQIRKFQLFNFLYHPVNIQFVRFSVYDGGRVGIYDKPMALPPEHEVKSGAYHYHDCPMELLPPIDHRTFFHYFWNHKRHPNPQSRLFLDRFPKKLAISMLQQGQQNELNLGWGIHIIEGPNKRCISLIMFAILILSWAVSLVYSIITKGQRESGFGIGQWMVATLTAGLSAVYFHVSD